MKIDQLNLNKMIETKLKKIGKIYYIEQLISYKEEELLSILTEEELIVLIDKLKYDGLYLHMIKSVSTLNLDEEVVEFLRDSYIHTLDELLLSKDNDLGVYKNQIDKALKEKNLTRICKLNNKHYALEMIKNKNFVLKSSIYKFRIERDRKEKLDIDYPLNSDSVSILGGKYEMLKAMGYETIDDIINLNRKQFLDLTNLLDEDLLEKLHFLGFDCSWEFAEETKVYKKA